MATSTRRLKCRYCKAVTVTDATTVHGVPIDAWWEGQGHRCTPCYEESRTTAYDGALRHAQHQLEVAGYDPAAASVVMKALHDWTSDKQDYRRPRPGVECVTCDVWAREYRRKINNGQVISMAKMFRVGGPDGTDWVDVVNDVGQKSREEGKLEWWGLVDRKPRELGEEPGPKGIYRLTIKGVLFLHGEMSVPKYAFEVGGKLRRLEGDPITVHDAYRERFVLTDLLAGF